MQSFRVRVPTQVYRVNKFAPVCPAAAPTTSTRNMSIFPRFVQSEFAQVARLLDDISQFQQVARHNYNSNNYPFGTSFRSFQPRFDVKEGKEAYELTGELPGCTDINVEFTDASTLTIRGRSSHSREEGTRPAGLVEGAGGKETDETAQIATEPTAAAASEPTAPESDAGSSYHKASVEDEDAPASVAGDDFVNVEAVATPATEATEAQTQHQQQQPQAEQSTPQQQQQQQSKYWVSERSVGEFTRTFTFPARVDQDAVRANLKDGILSVFVPKAAKATRKITVE